MQRYTVRLAWHHIVFLQEHPNTSLFLRALIDEAIAEGKHIVNKIERKVA